MNEGQESKSEEKFERMVTVLIAFVAILVAVIVYFQNYTSNLSDEARRAREYIVASTKTEISGAIQFSYQWHGAFQTWREFDLQKSRLNNLEILPQRKDTPSSRNGWQLSVTCWVRNISILYGIRIHQPLLIVPHGAEVMHLTV